MIGRDGAAGLVCLAGSLVLLAGTRGLPQPALVPIGPAFYPRILLVLTAVLAGALLVSDVVRSRRAPRAVSPPGRYRLVLWTFAIFAAYVVALPPFGYRLATFAFMVALQAVLEPPRGRGPLGRVLAVALATSLVTHAVFEGYLSVLLPRGWLTGF